MRIGKLLSITGMLFILGLSSGCIFSQKAEVKSETQTKKLPEQKVVSEVTMSHKSGVYAEDFSLTLNSLGASEVYYTLDGSSPVNSATRIKYEKPLSITDRSGQKNYVTAVDPVKFDTANAVWDSKNKVFLDAMEPPADNEVDKGTVVKAVAVDSHGNYGSVSTNTYFVGTVAQHIQGAKESAQAAGIPLSVMSISMDYNDLFDYEKGIYVRGKIFDESLKAYIEQNGTKKIKDKARNFPANYSQRGRDWERNAHIDYFETDGTALDCKLQQDCGIRIQGNYSRSDLMKGLRLYARADYGQKNFKYPFFQDAKDDTGRVIDKYKKLVLRNGGNYAFSGTKYNDAYWQSMLHTLECETQYSRACAVYIDGEYWGLYLLQQDYDDNYFEETHGVLKDSVVVYKASDAEADAAFGYKLDEGILPEKETDVNYYYKELLKFFDTHEHLARQSDYEAFTKLVDPQSVMDYFAVNVWVNNKWDWPDKNWSMWKTNIVDNSNKYSDGRWRFCFYDLDFGGCGGIEDAYVNTIKEGNYETDGKGLLGQNKTRPRNPALQCFILLMSNEGFREKFKKELEGFSQGIFEVGQAETKLNKFRDTYTPLFSQFYTRYYGAEEAEDYCWMTEYGYASYDSLRIFINERGFTMPTINEYLDEYYKDMDFSAPGDDDEDDKKNPPSPAKYKTLKEITVTAKKGKKTIQVKSTGKAKVTVSLKKKMILKGKKKVGKITLTSSKGGTATVKLSKKLTRGMKVSVVVKKSGYKTKRAVVKVK